MIFAAVAIALVGIAIAVFAFGRHKDPMAGMQPGQTALASHAAGDGDYEYTEAPDHIGETARVHGMVLKAFTSKSGATFLDFCTGFQACPFSAVIFAGDKDKFKDMSSYEREVTVTGLIKSYQGKAEIVVSDPSQIE